MHYNITSRWMEQKKQLKMKMEITRIVTTNDFHGHTKKEKGMVIHHYSSMDYGEKSKSDNATKILTNGVHISTPTSLL